MIKGLCLKGTKNRKFLSEKGQIVIPKPIREHFNIQPSTELIFDVEEEKIVIKKKGNSLDVFESFVNAVYLFSHIHGSYFFFNG